MEPILTPRAARYAKSHGLPVPTSANPPAVDWRVAKHELNQILDPKFRDHIFPVLYGEPTINDNQRADLWDLAHQAADSTELAGHLSQLPPLHPGLVANLL